MGERNYEEENKINKFTLDQEWLEQGDRYIYWSKRAANATALAGNVELRRKIKKAELYKKHRENFVMDNVKASENMIEAEVRTDPEYLEISQELLDAQEDARIMEDVKWNFQQRQERIKELQQLFLAGYFSTPQLDTGEIKKGLTVGLQGKLSKRRGEGG